MYYLQNVLLPPSPSAFLYFKLFLIHNKYLGMFVSDITNMAAQDTGTAFTKSGKPFSFFGGELTAVCESD
jgi:hypothetical protein